MGGKGKWKNGAIEKLVFRVGGEIHFPSCPSLQPLHSPNLSPPRIKSSSRCAAVFSVPSCPFRDLFVVVCSSSSPVYPRKLLGTDPDFAVQLLSS